MYYGLCKGIDIEQIAWEVCECLGHGNYENAHLLLLETIGAETHRGKVEDKSLYAGMGIAQFDKMPFYDVKNRVSDKVKDKVKAYFGIDIELVNWEDLRYNVLLSLIFCRLKYLLVPDSIPESFEARASYWKKWYNSSLGKGTTQHYIQANEGFMYA